MAVELISVHKSSQQDGRMTVAHILRRLFTRYRQLTFSFHLFPGFLTRIYVFPSRLILIWFYDASDAIYRPFCYFLSYYGLIWTKKVFNKGMRVQAFGHPWKQSFAFTKLPLCFPSLQPFAVERRSTMYIIKGEEPLIPPTQQIPFSKSHKT
jgi:hypothetical protein